MIDAFAQVGMVIASILSQGMYAICLQRGAHAQKHVMRLTTSLNLVGCITGRSTGFSLLRTLPTCYARDASGHAAAVPAITLMKSRRPSIGRLAAKGDRHKPR